MSAYFHNILIFLFLAIFVSCSLGSKKSGIKRHWYECAPEEKVVHTVKTSKRNKTFEITKCSYPKISTEKENGAYKVHFKDGSSCSYSSRPSENLPLLEKGMTLYGLWSVEEDGDRSKYHDCKIDIGFMVGLHGVRTFSSIFKLGDISKLHGPKINNGLITTEGFFNIELYNSTVWRVKRDEFVKLSFNNNKNEKIKHWELVVGNQASFSYEKIHKNTNSKAVNKRGVQRIKQAHSKKIIFKVGPNSSAFVTTKWAPLDSLGLRSLKLRTVGYTSRVNEKRTLHLFNMKNKTVYKTFKDGDYLLQPVFTNNKTTAIRWNIIKKLQGSKDLYGVLGEDGRFSAPSGTLGVRPVSLRRRVFHDSFSTGKRVPRKIGSKFSQAANFWLVAYKGKKWGKASADLKTMSGPIWSDIRLVGDNWLFAKQLKTNKWEIFDDYHLNLGGDLFSSLESGQQKLKIALKRIGGEDLKLATSRKKTSKMRSDKSDKLKTIREKNYYAAKRRRNVSQMKWFMKNSKWLTDDFYKSGFGTTAELKKYAIRSGGSIKFSKEIARRKKVDKKKFDKNLKKITQEGVEEELRRAETSRENYRAGKAKERSEWRKTVKNNAKKTNRAVKKTWDKHQTEMYKKGYIELPK